MYVIYGMIIIIIFFVVVVIMINNKRVKKKIYLQQQIRIDRSIDRLKNNQSINWRENFFFIYSINQTQTHMSFLIHFVFFVVVIIILHSQVAFIRISI